MQVQNTVFISYRRTDIGIANYIYQNLKIHHYDVFLDFESLNSGEFSPTLLDAIAARAHFVLILTPSAMERCVHADDWLRREIEYAIKTDRNIVPLLFNNFDFYKASSYMKGGLAKLSQYNGLNVPDGYYEEAMEKLRNRFLNKPMSKIEHPPPVAARATIRQSVAKARSVPAPSPTQIQAEQLFESGFSRAEASDYQAAINDYNQAIQLNPGFAEAYYQRGRTYAIWGRLSHNRADEQKAIADLQQAIRLMPNDRRINLIRSRIYMIQGDYRRALPEANEGIRRNPESHEAYTQRGHVYSRMDDVKKSVADFSQSIRLNPNHADAYCGRGGMYTEHGNPQAAIADYSKAIELNPLFDLAYYNRGVTRDDLGDTRGTIADYNDSLRLNPHLVDAYVNRGTNRHELGDTDGAIEDFLAALRIDPNHQMAQRNLDILRRQGWSW